MEIELLYQKLQDILKTMGRVVIAFSGGVDSALVLKVARDALGKDNVLAVTALSETTSSQEREDAVRLAETFGIHHLLVETRELDIPEFARNPEDRCYICKKHRFGRLMEAAADFSSQRGASGHDACVADGLNTDDCNDYRPGIRAARELGVRSPLCEAGMSKRDIRLLSKNLGIPTWNKPAFACLATRIPYHSPITAEKLRQTDRAETFLRESGFSGQVRVRHYGDTARIETEADDIPKLAEHEIRTRVTSYFKSLGFIFVTLDLEGYNMGSLNRTVI
jgi:uncharacterized protein